MKIIKLYDKEILNALSLLAILQYGFASPLMAGESCANILPASPSPQSAINQPSTDCNDYEKCIRVGQQLLQQGASDQAIIAFKQALKDVGLDDAKRSNAYGCIGAAYEAIPDKVMAEVYLEKAGETSGHTISWIEKEYKRLISTQSIVMAEDLERKVQAKREIQSLERGQMAKQGTSEIDNTETPQTITSAEGIENPPEGTSRTAAGMEDRERGFIVGSPKKDINVLAKDDSSENFKPNPTAHPIKREKPHKATLPSHIPEKNLSQEPSLDLRINFESGSATLTPEGEKQADELGKALQQIFQKDRDQHAVLVGHTDIIGSEEYNYHLSEDRAAIVKAYLSKNFPDLADKLSERGMGKRQPLYKEMDDESQRLNRRVEVKLSRTAE